VYDDELAVVKKLTKAAKAHQDGASVAVTRYASILGIPVPKV